MTRRAKPDPAARWISLGNYQAKCRDCGFVVFVGADATIEEHGKTCKGEKR